MWNLIKTEERGNVIYEYYCLQDEKYFDKIEYLFDGIPCDSKTILGPFYIELNMKYGIVCISYNKTDVLYGKDIKLKILENIYEAHRTLDYCKTK